MINSIRAYLAEFGIVAPVGRKGVTELLQKDDGTLHVRHESEHKGERTTEREIPLNDFMREGVEHMPKFKT